MEFLFVLKWPEIFLTTKNMSKETLLYIIQQATSDNDYT